jgi:hypothetical protein
VRLSSTPGPHSPEVLQRCTVVGGYRGPHICRRPASPNVRTWPKPDAPRSPQSSRGCPPSSARLVRLVINWVFAWA